MRRFPFASPVSRRPARGYRGPHGRQDAAQPPPAIRLAARARGARRAASLQRRCDRRRVGLPPLAAAAADHGLAVAAAGQDRPRRRGLGLRRRRLRSDRRATCGRCTATVAGRSVTSTSAAGRATGPTPGSFPRSVIGRRYEGFPDERWLDVSRFRLFARAARTADRDVRAKALRRGRARQRRRLGKQDRLPDLPPRSAPLQPLDRPSGPRAGDGGGAEERRPPGRAARPPASTSRSSSSASSTTNAASTSRSCGAARRSSRPSTNSNRPSSAPPPKRSTSARSASPTTFFRGRGFRAGKPNRGPVTDDHYLLKLSGRC